MSMEKTWIVVADNARARIFELVKQGRALNLVQEYLNPSSRAQESELTSDRPGRTFDSVGPGRHALGKSISPKEHEVWKLCKHLADEIESARVKGRFERLVLVAAPSFLGELRKMLSVQSSRLVVEDLDKNLSQMEAREILEHLPAGTLQGAV